MGSVTSNPNVTIQLSPSAIVDAFADRRDIIFGQIPAAGATATDGTLNPNVHLLNTAEIKTLCGSTSYLTNMILEWKATNEGYSPLDVIGVDEAGVAGTSVIVFTGTATAAGTLVVTFIDEQKYAIEIAVPIGMTAAVLTAAIETAYDALTDPIMVIDGTGTPGTVTATATDAGGICLNYGVKVDGAVAGLTQAITAWTSGTPTLPTLTAILTNISGIRYTGVIWPEGWADTLIVAEMESRFNTSNAIMDGTVFSGLTDTYGNDLTAAGENSQVLVLMGSPIISTTDIYEGPAIMKPADWVACEFLGIRSRRLTPGAPIADDIISTSGQLDNIGGPSLASLPYFNTPLRNTPVTGSTQLWTATEQAGLEAGGFSTYGVNSVQNAMIMGPVVTTYITDAGGNPNDSYHFLNYVDTGSACREVFYNVLKSTFAQSRLTEGDLIPQRSMANAASIKVELLRIYKFLSGLALTQAGATAEKFFSDNTTVTVSLATRTATIAGPLPIVTQLGTINYSLQLAFTITGTATQITV